MDRTFFCRNAEVVASDLLGKIIVRKIRGKEYRAKIVETEAYFGPEDPASRARQNGDLRETMEMDAGTILVYGVHNNWLLNFVTGCSGEAAAVLIRACEPLNFSGNLSGPGLLTRALKIDKDFHKRNILDDKEIRIEDFKNIEINKNKELIGQGELDNKKGKKGISINEFDNNKKFQIIESFRIGVVKDLPRLLRFYIKDNQHVSRK